MAADIDDGRRRGPPPLAELIEEIAASAAERAPLQADEAVSEEIPPDAVPDAGAMPARVVARAPSGKRREVAVPGALRDLGLSVAPLFPGAAELAEDPFGLREYFVVKLPGRRADVGRRGHDVAYRLAELPEVQDAHYEEAAGVFMPLASILGGGTPPADKDWARKAVKVPAGPPGGSGVVIGHPDTGWALHPELDATALDLVNQWNTLTDTADATDPLNYILFNGHGTGTGTVMVSSPAGQLTGVAPAARLLPIRCAQSVVLILDVELAQAIWYAIGKKVGVLSISLGGFPVPFLENVIAHAVHAEDIIVCASAGNVTPFVVYPAAYRDCIAVGGTTPTDRPWKNSSFGPQVAVSAPAHLVWVADFDSQRNVIPAAPASGTSFSAPCVAAAAALWLASHGRQQLRQRYGAGAVPLQEVFRRLVRQTARNPGTFSGPGADGDVSLLPGYTWQTDRYGAGILDVAALLAAPLPTRAEMEGFARLDLPLPWLDVIRDVFPWLTSDEVTHRIEALLGTTDDGLSVKLDVVGRELVQLLMSEPPAREAFLAAGRERTEDIAEGLNGVASMALLAEANADRRKP